MIKEVYCVSFSPCGGTAETTEYIGKKIAENMDVDLKCISYTLPAQREDDIAIPDDALVIWGSPVYAGRLPNKTLPFLQEKLKPSKAMAVPVVCFGNRDYGDALIELGLILNGLGMTVIGGAALVSAHVFTDKLAKGRPDEDDRREIDRFVGGILDKICPKDCEAGGADETSAISCDITAKLPGTNPPVAYYVPKGIDGQPAKFLKAHPVADIEKCASCRACADVCPMGTVKFEEQITDEAGNVTAVSHENPVFSGVCIKCHACINGCPKGALEITDAAFVSHRMMLEASFTERNSNCFVL